MFSFTSMGVTIDHSVNEVPGPYVFKINSHCHHLMGSLIPSYGEQPKSAQLYSYDTDNEVSNRLAPFTNDSVFTSLDENIINGLIDKLNNTNELTKLFRSANERVHRGIVRNYKLRLIGPRDNDSRKYDDPVSSDIGGLVVEDIGVFSSEHDIIIIESCSGSLQRTSKLHPEIFMALQYPLLFPFGEDEFHCNIPLAEQTLNNL